MVDRAHAHFVLALLPTYVPGIEVVVGRRYGSSLGYEIGSVNTRSAKLVLLNQPFALALNLTRPKTACSFACTWWAHTLS